MSEEKQAVRERWEDLLHQKWEAFRQSRLSLQIIAALGLVAVTGLVSVLPAAPVARVRQALTRTVNEDYDFAGRWAQARKWADARGGWRSALAGTWNEQLAKVKKALPAPAAPAVKEAPAVVEQEPPAAEAIAADPAAETVMPVTGKVLYGFGWLPKGQEPHGGLDLAAAVGTAVVAMADGTVLRVAADPAVGGLVEVDHGFAVAMYGQVGGAKVKAGEKVKKGQSLAAIAKPTGKEGDHSPHLHLEVRPARGAKAVDPAPFLPLSGAQGGSGN